MKKRRLLSILLTLCMVLALMPQMAFADTVTGITYLDASGAQQTCDNATVVTGDDTTWGTDEQTTWYVAQGDVNISSSVTVNGDVHLILADDCSLTVNGNITGGSLTIYGQAGGTGKLNVSGSIISGNGVNDDFDVVGSVVGTGGSITINGGVVEAGSITGGTGGYSYYGRGGDGGSIIINGGVIDAGNITGGNGGGNMFEGTGGDGGNISIRNGMVKTDNITGGNGGNGGDYEHRNAYGGNGGNITISGHIVEAGNINNGSGGGYGNDQIGDPNASGINGNNGNIIIDGGIVFQVDSGQVYGTSVTLGQSFTISTGKTLTIDSGKSLIVSDDVTLYVDGTLNGTVNGNGDVYYNLAPTDCTVSSTGIEKHNEKTYAKEGSEITLTPDTPQVGYLFDSWEVSPESVQINNNNSFTMPNEALTVTAKWIECPHDGDKETRNAKEATCTEAGYSGDVYCLVCNKMITKGHDTNMVSHKLKHIPKTDATVTETGNDEYWQCTVCDKYFSDAEGTNEITDLESWKAGDGKIDKLPPEIIEGKGQSITEGEKKALSFTSNAAYSDFIRVELDGSELSEENYEKAEGSIIITLDADYVATLPAGEHTIGIVSESGTAETTFTVEEKAAPGTSDDSDRDSKADADKNAKTGDDANLALWLALMILAGAGIAGTTVYTRRKRTNE